KPADLSAGFSHFLKLEPGNNNEFVAPILRATVFLAAGGARRTLFAVSYNLESRSIDSAIRQITGHDRRPLLAQRQIVFVGAAVIRVALDAYANARIPLQRIDLLVERADTVVRYVRTVKLEIHRCRDCFLITGLGSLGATRGVAIIVRVVGVELGILAVGRFACGTIGGWYRRRRS